MKARELRKLPWRERGEDKFYKSLLVISSGKKHDSGWALMYIIGKDDSGKLEIAAACDDINWEFPIKSEPWEGIRNDMYYPSGVLQFWSNKFKFDVGLSCSSTDVKIVRK